ncbi:hypothetical protein KKC87_03980, partial [Patescibacteria group bacterium]|nr:hypothetical protein [Patescibacteria group bacterium]
MTSKITSLTQFYEYLADISTFPKDIFYNNEIFSEQLSSFVLLCSIIFNDLKNLTLFYSLVNNS